MTTALVTGGAGFIGSHVAQGLLDRGFAVTILDDLSSGRRDLVPAEAKFVEGSVASPADLERAFEREPTCVVHLAALFANQKSIEQPVQDLRVNGEGTLNVLRMCVDRGVEKVVNVSSSCVYGNQLVMQEDELELLLDTPYAATKLLGEHYAEICVRLWGLNVVTVRPFNTYGPHEYPGQYRNVVPNFFIKATEGRPLPITGTGEETRDFTFVGDTAAGMIGALLGDTRPGDVFNLASGRETSIVDLARRINEVTGNEGGIEYLPRRSWDHVKRRRGDTEKAKAAFGFEAAVSLADGLAATYDWLKSVQP